MTPDVRSKDDSAPGALVLQRSIAGPSPCSYAPPALLPQDMFTEMCMVSEQGRSGKSGAKGLERVKGREGATEKQREREGEKD